MSLVMAVKDWQGWGTETCGWVTARQEEQQRCMWWAPMVLGSSLITEVSWRRQVHIWVPNPLQADLCRVCQDMSLWSQGSLVSWLRLSYLESWVTKRKSTQASLVAVFWGFDSCVSPRKVWVDGEEKVCCRPDPRGLYFDSLVEGTFALSLSLCPRRSISQNTVGRSNWLTWVPPPPSRKCYDQTRCLYNPFQS